MFFFIQPTTLESRKEARLEELLQEVLDRNNKAMDELKQQSEQFEGGEAARRAGSQNNRLAKIILKRNNVFSQPLKGNEKRDSTQMQYHKNNQKLQQQQQQQYQEENLLLDQVTKPSGNRMMDLEKRSRICRTSIFDYKGKKC